MHGYIIHTKKNMNIKTTTIIKSLVSLFVMISCCVFCSCQPIDTMKMKAYLNNHSQEMVLEVEQKIDKNQKTAKYNIILEKDDDDMSLDRIENIRKVVNAYMVSDKNSYLNQGYQVFVSLQNGSNFASSKRPVFFAFFSNVDEGYLKYHGNGDIVYQETKEELKTLMFRFDPGDEEYLSLLSDVDTIIFAGIYHTDDTKYMNKLFSEIEKLSGDTTIKVNQQWYPAFVNAGLDCDIREETSDYVLFEMG